MQKCVQQSQSLACKSAFSSQYAVRFRVRHSRPTDFENTAHFPKNNVNIFNASTQNTMAVPVENRSIRRGIFCVGLGNDNDTCPQAREDVVRR